jgi:hypothetical protein
MIITKKRHEKELADAIEKAYQKHRSDVEQLKKIHAEEKKLISEFIDRAQSWIRVHAHERFDSEGRPMHSYSVHTEFTAEFLHYAVGGSHKIARMITNELAEKGYLAIVALCHLDQPPKLYNGRRD